MPSLSTVKIVGASLESEAELAFSPSAIRAAIRRREEEIKVLKNALQVAERVGPLLETRESIGKRNPQEVPLNGGTNGSGGATNLRETVCELASGMRKFTSGTILEALKQRNFQFIGDPKGAVRDAIYELKKQRKIKIIKEGKGGQPNFYELQK
jgi:hypothetical protein